MNRRKFLMNASSLALPVALNGFGLKALASDSALVRSLMAANVPIGDRVLVIIYLNGGNDGFNTVIPLDQMSAYTNLRTNIAIPENRVLTLSGNAATGFHPAMTGMRDLYNDGKLSIIHSVSYPNPDQSHFRSTDIWMTGSDANQYHETGWAGRYLDDRFLGYPANYPNTQMEDPLAIQIGYLTSTTLLGPTQSMGIAINDPNSFYQLVGAASATSPEYLPCCDAGDLIAFIRKQQALSVGYATEIKAAYDAGRTLATTYPTAGQNSLADQLKIVARLIHGGLKTKIYFVSLGGFDTHSGQVDNSDNTIGAHATLLGRLSSGIKTFQEDLTLQGIADKVVGMTFSEFGRRANSNNSKGTDHGVAAPQFVFGNAVKRSVIGTNPDLANLITTSGGSKEVPMQIDFRRIYTDILNEWFGAGTPKTNSLLFRSSQNQLDFPTISLFSNVVETVSSGNWTTKTTWTVGRQPLPGEYVRVCPGHTVTVGQNISVKGVKLDGKIQFTGPYKLTITG
jgi:uncharacterized protein (DUF1501 family)